MRFNEFTKQQVSEGMLDNPGSEDNPVAQAIIRRILMQRTDLLAKYGPEKVGAAVDEVADFVGDVDEIGSSDVSGWIRHVEQMLGNMTEQDVAEGQSPISAGRRAGKAGKPLAPPHPKDSPEYKEFEKGWNEKENIRKANKLAPYNKQGVAEGLPQTLRKIVPGYAKREIDKKMDAQKFGRTDVDKDANYYRYKKIQDKLKGQGVTEAGSGRDSWDSNMPGYQGDYGGAENWGRRSREDDEHHEIDRRMEQEREHRNTHGTWYVRVDGQVIPKSYTGKAAANAAALEFKKQPGNENKLVMLTMKEQ
jgi:hypothetical protein